MASWTAGWTFFALEAGDLREPLQDTIQTYPLSEFVDDLEGSYGEMLMFLMACKPPTRNPGLVTRAVITPSRAPDLLELSMNLKCKPTKDRANLRATERA